jgi:hypothetical protein
VVVDWAGRNARHVCYRHSYTRPGGCCEHLDASAPPALRSTFAPGPYGAASGRTLRGAPIDGATAPTGEHEAVGPQFPYGMRNTMTTYASSVSTDIAAYEDLTGHHLLAVRNCRCFGPATYYGEYPK